MAQTSLIGEVVEWRAQKRDNGVITDIMRRGVVIAENPRTRAVCVVLGSKLDPHCPEHERGVFQALESGVWHMHYPPKRSAPMPSRKGTFPGSR